MNKGRAQFAVRGASCFFWFRISGADLHNYIYELVLGPQMLGVSWCKRMTNSWVKWQGSAAKYHHSWRNYWESPEKLRSAIQSTYLNFHSECICIG